ncbi:hypothetical protein GQ42DRAFT_161522 [Ramicandelaber brevisporus]|nr:hypothetical protein GQ42DRAFT_161522 [Ramicandelaber brevisporus]
MNVSATRFCSSLSSYSSSYGIVSHLLRRPQQLPFIRLTKQPLIVVRRSNGCNNSSNNFRFYSTSTSSKNSSSGNSNSSNSSNSSGNSNSSNSSSSSKGWRKYADQFRNRPASHLIAFGILHEVTAIIPLVAIFAYLQTFPEHIEIPIPDSIHEACNEWVNRTTKYLNKRFGSDIPSPDSRTFVNLAAAYAVVKIALPVRIAACFAMTPWTANRILHPIYQRFKHIRKS